MDIYIYGAGKKGNDLYQRIRESEAGISVKGFIDRNKEGENIVSLETISKSDIIIISIADEMISYEVAEELERAGFQNVYWNGVLNNPIYDAEFFLKKECLRLKKPNKPILKQVEMHIADKCNLNCAGCAHYSPIFDELGTSYEMRMEDVKALSERDVFIHRFYLLGGEPFLNPEITKYIIGMKDILQETDLHIVTNGLLLLSVDEEVLRTIAEYDVTVSISEYETTHKVIDEIKERLEKHHIKYIIRPYDKKQMFNKPLSLSKNSVRPKLCISDGCVNIWNGKISRCPAVMYIERFNEVFGTELPKEGIVRITDAPKGEELLEFLQEEIPLCEHCVENPIPWSRCGKKYSLSDFATED